MLPGSKRPAPGDGRNTGIARKPSFGSEIVVHPHGCQGARVGGGTRLTPLPLLAKLSPLPSPLTCMRTRTSSTIRGIFRRQKMVVKSSCLVELPASHRKCNGARRRWLPSTTPFIHPDLTATTAAHLSTPSSAVPSPLLEAFTCRRSRIFCRPSSPPSCLLRSPLPLP